MGALIILLLIIAFIMSIILFVMTIRNNWVFKVRMKLLDSCREDYDKLMSYDQMMFRFWVWNVNKLNKPS